jgi:hypothetical protein
MAQSMWNKSAATMVAVWGGGTAASARRCGILMPGLPPLTDGGSADRRASLTSSPWIRRQPHEVFWVASRPINAVASALIGGSAGRLRVCPFPGDQGGEHGTVSPVRPRVRDLPPQHRDFMPQHEDLRVLRGDTHRYVRALARGPIPQAWWSSIAVMNSSARPRATWRSGLRRQQVGHGGSAVSGRRP